MLRNTGIRSKILAVLAVPVLVLLLAATVVSTSAVSQARRATQVEALAAASGDLSAALRAVEAERSATVGVPLGRPDAAATLAAARTATDTALAAALTRFDAVDGDVLPAEAVSGVAAVRAAAADLPAVRGRLDSGEVSVAEALSAYEPVLNAGVSLPVALAAGVDDNRLAGDLRAFADIETAVELVTREQELVASVLQDGAAGPEQVRELASLAALQDQALAEVTADAGTARAEQLAQALAADAEGGPGFDAFRAQLAAAGTGAVTGVDAGAWTDAAQARVAVLTTVQRPVALAAEARAGELAGDLRSRSVQVVLGAAAAVVVPLLLALLISSSIVRPVRQLTAAATELRLQLPRLLDGASETKDAGTLALPEIAVDSSDEVGRLAAALNDVNRTTVDVAREQVALRAAVAGTFVDIARRNQVLLSRQLALIDQLERSEESPEALEDLFRLDHLATRMRRNAESLLVLAGVESTRRLRRPMPLSDVVRTASSEIEQYDRIDLALRDDPPVVGHVALVVSHLLAELLENATAFSDPGTRVVVSAAPGPRGLTVSVHDEGLGMPADDLERANERLRRPQGTATMGTQRLGLSVVARLAERLDVAVTLSAAPGRGTVARIELPAVLFAHGSVVAPAELGATDAVAPAELDLPAAVPALSGPPAADTWLDDPQDVVDEMPRGIPALDIVPSRGAARGSLRRPRRERPAAPAGGRPAAARPAAGGTQPAGAAPSAGAFVSAPGASPVGAVPTASPYASGGTGLFGPPPGSAAPSPFTAPVASAAPATPAPSSLFGPPPAATPAPSFGAPAPALPTLEPIAPRPAAAPATPAGPAFAAPAQDGEGSGDRQRQRSALASEALTELSKLSTYRPAKVDQRGPVPLARRTPGTTPAAAAGGSATPPPLVGRPLVAPSAPIGGAPSLQPGAGGQRQRTAADVRSMLSGYQAGVARARTDGDPAPSAAPDLGTGDAPAASDSTSGKDLL